MFVGHVRELELHSSTRVFSPELLSRLLLGPQLRRFELDLQGDEEPVDLLPRRSWDDVKVDVVVHEGQPLEEALQKIKIVKPRRVSLMGFFDAGNSDFLGTESGRSLEEKLFDVLRSVPEVSVIGYEKSARWVPLLSRLPGRTSLDLATVGSLDSPTETPSDLLRGLQQIDEICIVRFFYHHIEYLPNFAVHGTAVVELNLDPELKDYFLPTHYFTSLPKWFPNLQRLHIGLEVGCETHLPCVLSKLPKLTNLSLTWREREGAEGYRQYRPQPGAVVEGIERCAGLAVVRLVLVELDADELGRILRHLGGRLQGFLVKLGHGPGLLEKVLAVAAAAAEHCPALRWLDVDAQKTRTSLGNCDAWKRKLGAAGRRKLGAAGRLLEKRCLSLGWYWFERFYE